MVRNHEPDPKFVDNLEWQLGNELRRQRGHHAPSRPVFRVVKIAALVMVSVVLGAAGMDVSQQLQETWRRELLEARLAVQVEFAAQRLQMQRETAALMQDRYEQGLLGERDLAQLQLQIASAEADVMVTRLDLEEVRSSGREPLGELSSPLVDERDFVSERVRARMDVARRRFQVTRLEAARTQEQVALGVTDEREGRQRLLAMREAELQVQALEQRLELRRQYLASEITAVEAELKLLEVEAQHRVGLRSRQLQSARMDLGTLQDAERAGALEATFVSQMRTRIAEIEGQLSLAQRELQIVRRELERRAEER